jgi:hypothetical protein
MTPTELPSPADERPAQQLAQTLDDLIEGQARLSHELARSRRHSFWMAGLLVLAVALGAEAWYDHVGAVPIVLPGHTEELDREDLVAQVEGLLAQVRNARDERNEHLGISLQLREQLVKSERRISELMTGLGSIAADVVAQPAPVASVSRYEDRDLEANPARLVSDALAASGVTEFSIVEHGPVEDGRLRDVLMTRHDASGAPTAAEHFDRASLQMRFGVVELVLERDALEDGSAELIEVVPMPAADLAAWAAAGMALDDERVTVARASEALSAVLVGQTMELVSLGGYDAGQFFDLVLVERDRRGSISRTWTAELAELLPVGPTLLLEGGHLEEGGVTRPFWNGRTRLVLEGALYNTFLTALRGSAGSGTTRRG